MPRVTKKAREIFSSVMVDIVKNPRSYSQKFCGDCLVGLAEELVGSPYYTVHLPNGYKTDRDRARRLGLSGRQLHDLFWIDAWPEEIRKQHARARSAGGRARAGAARLAHLLATGE